MRNAVSLTGKVLVVAASILLIAGPGVSRSDASDVGYVPEDGARPENIRFEDDAVVRIALDKGDCRPVDCRIGRERTEFTSVKRKRAVGRDGARIRYAFEIYFPDGFESPKNGMGLTVFQVEVPGVHPALDLFLRSSGDLRVRMDHADEIGSRDARRSAGREPVVLPEEQLRGRWHRVVVDANWARDDTGFIRVEVDGRRAFSYEGRTIAKGRSAYAKFGLCRWDVARDPSRGRTEVLFRNVSDRPV